MFFCLFTNSFFFCPSNELFRTELLTNSRQQPRADTGNGRINIRTYLECREEAKRQRYTVRCRAEGITFIPFVLDEFGHLGDCATLLLDALADRYAERARGDYREGRDAGQRRAAFLMRWRTRITYAAHSAVIRCIQERARRSLVQSMRIRGP